MKRSATISDCGKYRYELTREWAPIGGTATFVMLNPSTADAEVDDPTIRKCIGFAKLWNCRRLVVLNLFAVRATKPRDMRAAIDPIGPNNRKCIKATVTMTTGPVICAWGTSGGHMGQDREMLNWLTSFAVDPVCLGVTKDGHPRHPLYVPYSAVLTPYRRPAA